MTRYWLAGAAACALIASSALAQSVPQPTTVIPNGSVAVTQTQHTVDANGVVIDSDSTASKSETLIDGNGALSTVTHTQSAGQTTVTPPPVTTTTTWSTTTTTE
jgi:hypothetical protein